MRTHPTKAVLLAVHHATIQRLASHPALSFVDQLRVLDLPKMNYGQAIFCAGWLQLRTEWRPDALRQVVARTEARKGYPLPSSPTCQVAAVVWYICPAGDQEQGRHVRRVLLPVSMELPPAPAGWEIILSVRQN